MTASSISGRSEPSTSRAGVSRLSRPSLTRAMTVSAVNALLPLAIPKRVASATGTPCARSASPRTSVHRSPGDSPSLAAMPENPDASAASTTSDGTSIRSP